MEPSNSTPGARPPWVHSLAEVAARTGFSARTLRDRCRRREVQHVQFGRTIGLTPAQVEKLIASCTVETLHEDALAVMRVNRRRRKEREERERRRQLRA